MSHDTQNLTLQGAAQNPASARNPWAALAVLCAGYGTILLDLTVVNNAMPSIIGSLHTGVNGILWVINAYVLVYAVLLITAGRVGDLVGQRAIFAGGLALFTVASALCGFAQTTTQLVAARILQGVGGALLTPQTLALVTSIFPPDRRGTAMGLWGAVVVFLWLLAVPVLDRGDAPGWRGRRRALTAGAAVAVVAIGLGVYAWLSYPVAHLH